LRRRQLVTREARTCVPERVVHFGKIVVLGGQPENRDGIHSSPSDVFGEAHGAQRLEEAVDRAGKQAHLLTSYDGDGARRQAIEVAFGFFAGAQAAVLLAKRCHHFAAHPRIELDLASGREDSLIGGRMRVIAGNAAEILEKRGKELGRVGDFAERETVRLHRRNHDTRGLGGQQQARDGERGAVGDAVLRFGVTAPPAVRRPNRLDDMSVLTIHGRTSAGLGLAGKHCKRQKRNTEDAEKDHEDTEKPSPSGTGTDATPC
jgi:hypothetical protein